mmetsp:Transcript_6806/g.10716  ORF Transcript_6806/g.10716 Transcript_6806/m.10716 type:complete len:1726 (-) Transcript_6806:104-5281(-)
MFLASADSLKYAISTCQSGDSQSALAYVDGAAMLFVGSMGGNAAGGEFLYTTAKEFCSDFGTCITGSDGGTTAAASEVIMTSLNDAAETAATKNCDETQGLVQNTIIPTMIIPLIQGTLKYASYNANLDVATTDASLAIGDAFSRAVLPLVNLAAPTSASTIQTQMEFQLSSKPVMGGFQAVADAFRASLAGMNVQCNQIGVLVDEPVLGNLCGDGTTGSTPVPSPTAPGTAGPAPTPVPVSEPVSPTSPDQIAFGRYTFSDSSIADGDGSFALDIRGMFVAATTNDASTIYNDGQNAVTKSLSGDVGTVSLSSLSTQAGQYMAQDPMFNIYKYALYDDTDFDSSSTETFTYADDVVVEALTNGNDNKLAAEASVVLNVWMLITHRLYSAINVCRQSQSPEPLLDSAVALWIGKDQGEGKFDQGWMIYSIGQSSSKFYGYPEGEAPVNSKLMNLFVEAQTVARSCTSAPTAHMVLRSMVHEIIRTLTKPLVLSLLFHMAQNSKNMVELYAVAVVPQCSACSAQASVALKDALYSGFHQETSITDELLDHLATFLRCQKLTCEDLKTGDSAVASLTDLSEKLCSRLDYGSNSNAPMANSNLPLAGYIPKNAVQETARLDMDALEMYIMMRTRAYEAARDVYEYGHNSVAGTYFQTEPSDTDILSLKFLATSTARTSVPQMQYYTNYFGSQNYADDIILQAVGQSGQYATATRPQLAQIVSRTSQAMISYMAILQKMQSSIDNCKNGSTDDARSDWDRAVALFVGSSQGFLAGAGQGEWMYALGNEVCSDFSACETSGEAKINEQLMFLFAGGRDSLVDGECDHLERTTTSDIIPNLAIPLIQGTISYSMKVGSSSSSDSESMATLHILSQAVTPLVQKADSSAASVLSQSFGTLQSASNPGVATVLNAFGSALKGMGIPCADIGSPTGYTFCSSEQGESTSETVEDTPTSLANDLYVTTTYVQDRANIAKDIQDMSEALRAGSNELAKIVYREGKNSEEFDDNGKFVKLRSLKRFSTETTNEMLDEPEFNFYLYALQGNQFYADDLVEEALQNASPTNPGVATEAALVLNLWMTIVHMMHETLQACKEKKLRDDAGVHAMDVAVAYWIGDGQIAGDAENGHLLYALSENFAEKFNIDDGGQSRTNSNILRLFNEAKNEVALPNACSDSRMTYARLRRITNQIISQMAIPLVQGLILNLRANDRERVKIYAHAYLPLVAGCSPSLFDSLKEKLLTMSYNVVDVESIIDLVRKSYPCLGLQCDDIGVHEAEVTDEAPECDDPDVFAPLAGYKPSSDVREYSRLDLDIRQIDILLQMKAYNAADEVYSYGKHVHVGPNGGSLSLSELATTSERSVVPSYDAFARYYSKDTWADDVIRTALDPSQAFWSDDQRRVVAVKASQVLVTYFGAMQNAYEAVSSCSSAQQLRSTGSTESWDKVAAILIGHLEGTKTNGTVEGYMLYDLSQQHCVEFGTCLDDVTTVDTNEDLVSLLYTGRGAALENSCRALRKAADEMSSLLLIPMIQGALSTSMALSHSNDDLIRAEAYVYSRALLPLVRDRGAAVQLDEYLGNPGPQNPKHTAAEVYSALATAYPDMGVDCEKIGDPSGYDPCSGVVYGVSDTVWIIVGVLGGILLASCCCFIYFRSKQKTAKLPENNPKFFPSEEGELNHSMDLLEKAFASTPSSNHTSVGSQTPETEALNRYHDAEPLDDDDFEDVASIKSNMESAPDII